MKVSIFNKITVLAFLILSVQGCTPLRATDITDYTPAVMVSITPESQAELQQVVASSLGLPSVKIMMKALTKKSTFYIEKSRLLGFDLDKPTVFKLLKHQNRCILVNKNTKKIYGLTKVQCIAL